jgi:hypothetical protein
MLVFITKQVRVNFDLYLTLAAGACDIPILPFLDFVAQQT